MPLSPSAPGFPAPLGGELFLGVLGAEAEAGDLDEVGPVGQPVERRGGEQGLAEELWPLRAITVTGERDGGLFIAFVDHVVEVFGPGRAKGFEPEVVQAEQRGA